LAIASGVLVAVPAQAASLELTSGWSNMDVPTYVTMYLYVPDTLAANPPIMVASHYCGGNAAAYFSFASNIVALANQYGFIMIFPQTSNNCWDVGSTNSLTHNGGGDTQAIAEMVQYTITKYSADAGRVYAMGSSSGAMMTEALMGVYPNVFKAGAEMSGVPDGCWAVAYTSSDEWSSPCADGTVSMTAMQWGDLVRAQYPAYAGPRPRLWLWVGTADTTISPNNLGQAVLEWTNVLGLSATPTSTDTPETGYTGQLWNNSCGLTVLEAWTLQGGGHAPVPTTMNAGAIIAFFGLDESGPDPAAGCGDAGSSDASSVGTMRSDAGGASGDASSVGSDASSVGAIRGDASSAIGDAGSGGSSSDGGGASTGNGGKTGNAGCGCRMSPANESFGGILLAQIGAALGVLRSRRRRSRT
jgi:poly(hydroxyalkanoate) depolymerase family esterase